jgi:hypothetical protein
MKIKDGDSGEANTAAAHLYERAKEAIRLEDEQQAKESELKAQNIPVKPTAKLAGFDNILASKFNTDPSEFFVGTNDERLVKIKEILPIFLQEHLDDYEKNKDSRDYVDIEKVKALKQSFDSGD